jgi:hypothetical protein
MSDGGLNRLVELLETNSPLLIRGAYTRAMPMGCLATHVAWHHPETCHLTLDAGIHWLSRVAKLNPATSRVIREWDAIGPQNMHMRADLLQLLHEEKRRRRARPESQTQAKKVVRV